MASLLRYWRLRGCKIHLCFKALHMLFLLACSLSALAGTLTQGDIERRFLPPLHVGEKLSEIPAWPLTSELEPEAGPVCYVFESVDLAPIPGFEGTPMNFLVSIDRKGNFLDVELLHQHEPVFLGGLGEAPLREYLTQYAGRNIKQQFLIALDAARNRTGGSNLHSAQTTLDGVAKATASIRIVNQSVLGSALEVARAKLGFAPIRQRGPAAEVRPEINQKLSFAQLLEQGMLARHRVSHREIEALFKGSEGEGVDEIALSKPEETFVDLYIAYLNAPTIGRSLLGDAQYRTVMARNFDNRHLWWIATAGRDNLVDEQFVPGSQLPRLSLSQDGLILELRDQGFEPLVNESTVNFNSMRIFGVFREAGFDPGRSAQLALTVTRAKGMILPTLTDRIVTLEYQPPSQLFIYPPAPTPEWLLAWKARLGDLFLLASALTLLSIFLARPVWIARHPTRLRAFRLAFLAFTLIWVGWYAQGQLSIVQITGAIKSLRAGHDLSSYLYDPISLLLIVFTLISFAVWGRGTFCGWLCPFGALQEFIGLLARHLRLPRWKISSRIGRKLEWGRYVALGILIGAAALFPRQGEVLNEIEPFKTAITVAFDRSWPFVAWAAALLLVGAFYYKFFCRFLCPLGAVMSLGGRLRIFNWLTRRSECGKPCQRCRVVCEYDAIEPEGHIRYDACFQCMDCIGIYHDKMRCVPIIVHARSGRTLPTHRK